MKLDIDKCVVDPTIYPRTGVNEFNVNRLINAMNTSVKLPPITVEAKTFRIVDGRHRYEAHKRLRLKTIEAEQKVYKNEADLFADAVRRNIVHGVPLDQYSVRSAIVKLTTYGYSKAQISEVIRLPVEEITRAERTFASNESGEAVALKGGLAHLAGQTLDPQQLEINRRYSGPKSIFFIRQIAGLLANDMYPRTQTFFNEMDALCELWRTIKIKEETAA